LGVRGLAGRKRKARRSTGYCGPRVESAGSMAAALGDRRWRELLEQYYTVARRVLSRFCGREVDTAGDWLFAAFDGPARADPTMRSGRSVVLVTSVR